MAQISLKRVSKIYPNEVRALHDIELTVAERELLVIVGPSGSGKTTALRLIAGLESPTAGQVTFDQVDVTQLAPSKRNVAMVFQEDALYPHLSVGENLGFGLKMQKCPREEIDQRVTEIASRLGIEQLLGRGPNEISGGQKQRVALGKALIKRPNVCLLDEPFSNLDPQLRESATGGIDRCPSTLRDDDGLRDPRPPGSHANGGSNRCHRRRQDPAGRFAWRNLPISRQSLCRQFRGQPTDEFCGRNSFRGSFQERALGI